MTQNGSGGLPLYLRNRRLLHFHRNSSKRLYNDNMSFFRCLSYFLYKSINKAETLYSTYYKTEVISNFHGVSILEIDAIEKHFKIGIDIFSLTLNKSGSTSVKHIRAHEGLSPNIMCLNLYRKNYSLIQDINRYQKLYQCKKCYRYFTKYYNYRRHIAIKKPCTETAFYYKGGIYRNSKTIFQKLYELGVIKSPNTVIYPYFIAFDFECYFKKINTPAGESKSNVVMTDHNYTKTPSGVKLSNLNHATELNFEHIPLSAAVASNFNKYKNAKCFVRKSNSKDPLVEEVLDYIVKISCEIGQEMTEMYLDVFNQLDILIKESVTSDPKQIVKGAYKKFLSNTEKVRNELTDYLKRVPVLGFNSSKYDLNIMKREFHEYFSTHEKNEIHTIKKGNQYIAVYTETCTFLDVLNYLAPGYNYANYLKAFLNNETKGFFPYEWMDDIRKLNNRRLPPINAFYSSLKNKTISESEYQECKQIWSSKNMETMKDYLIFYNTQDVEPFVRAIEKHRAFFTARQIDMFKDGSTLPGLTLRFLFDRLDSENTVPYVLYSTVDQDIHELVRRNLVGGPSIIFHRHHKAGRTSIRKHIYKEQSKRCEHILGVDANSLYLKCMGEEHCAGYYITYKESNNYKAVQSQKVSMVATEWLRYRKLLDQTEILHEMNHGEVRVGIRSLPVDGFAPATKTVYQFQGCYWHGHQCHLTQRKFPDSDHISLMHARAKRTEDNNNYIISLGYKLIEQRECEWEKEKAQVDIEAYGDLWKFPKLTKFKFSDYNDIINAIVTGNVFGLIEVDIHTPDELKGYFEEMTPIFKHAEVGRDDVGDHMNEYLVSTHSVLKPRNQLIGSYFGKKILLSTPLLKWYLEKGLVVTKVYLLVQYYPCKTFEPFVDEVTAARRQGDHNTGSKILSDLYKLLGNSSYGKTICNKKNFNQVRYVSPKTASKLALHWSVLNVEELGESTVEITKQPTCVTYDLPIQIGFMVYQYAKLKMLQFYYDFLDKYVDRRDFELCEMDTDSLYFALSSKKLDDMVIKSKRAEYFEERHKWLPSESCDFDHHREMYIKARTFNLPFLPQPCCKERLLYDKRTPGLFKIEWEGDELTSLNSKCYIGTGDFGPKQSCKGVIQSQNELSTDKYENVLNAKTELYVSNTGFKVNNHTMVTYSQRKKGLTYTYIKRKTLSDGVSTSPLDI